MNIKIDPYTGEEYDADKWRRGAFGCWVNVEAEKRHNELIAASIKRRRDKLNESRVAKGKRRKSDSQFDRSSARYAEWTRQDSAETFGEFLKRKEYGRKMYCERY